MATAADRGWGPAPARRSAMVDVKMGTGGVNAVPGVHRRIAPLVEELARRWETITGDDLVPGWCWGYSSRRIRGGLAWSNHAWGLAVDFNAPRWGLGSNERPPNAPQMRAAADELGFRWGAYYSGRRDPMHFEFIGTPQDADRLIAGLDLTDDDEDEAVEELTRNIQTALVAAGFDLGDFGPEGDGVDGVWGEATQTALTAALTPQPTPDLSDRPTFDDTRLLLAAAKIVP